MSCALLWKSYSRVPIYFLYDRQRRIYPPGPRALPILGNILNLHLAGDSIWIQNINICTVRWKFWLLYSLLDRLLGPISSVKLFEKVLVIVNDVDVALDSLEKKSKITSDRHPDICERKIGWKKSPSHIDYVSRLLIHKKQIHQIIGAKSSVSQFYPLQEVATHRFLLRAFIDPTRLFKNVYLYVQSFQSLV